VLRTFLDEHATKARVECALALAADKYYEIGGVMNVYSPGDESVLSPVHAQLAMGVHTRTGVIRIRPKLSKPR